MRIWLSSRWQSLRASFWFIPTIMILLAVVGAAGTITVDQRMSDEWLDRTNWLYSGGADGATTLLGTIAGSMVTIAGTVFSLTLVALSLASNQFGPRLLRNFMRDRGNQFVLGTFLATFIFCVLILRSVRREDYDAFVPHLGVSLSVLLALVSILVLIYFIHHISVSIQADEVIGRISREIDRHIERMCPDPFRSDPIRDDTPPGDAGLIRATRDGYIQTIATDMIVDMASEADVRIRLFVHPGNYLVCGMPIAIAHTDSGAPAADDVCTRLRDRVRSAMSIDVQRNQQQDIEFGIHQLVEVAVRALSPGVNDPFTAVTCVDRLGSALASLATRNMPCNEFKDDDETVRLVTPALRFADVVDTAFDQIRQASTTNVAVTTRVLEAIEQVLQLTSDPARRDALIRQARRVATHADRFDQSHDRDAVEQRMRRILTGLAPPAQAPTNWRS